jgi:hypothetical protein
VANLAHNNYDCDDLALRVEHRCVVLLGPYYFSIFFYAKIAKQSQSHNINNTKKSTADSREWAANQYILTYEKTFLLLLFTKTHKRPTMFY